MRRNLRFQRLSGQRDLQRLLRLLGGLPACDSVRGQRSLSRDVRWQLRSERQLWQLPLARDLESTTITARDGRSLGATIFRAEDAKATVIIAPASATPQSFYRHFAAGLASAGFDTLTFDYRGIGRSRPPSLRGFEATMRQWGSEDLSGAITWARAQGCAKVFLVGHSAGGQLVGVAEGVEQLDGVYLAASSSGYYGHWQGLPRLAIKSTFYLIPALARIFGYLPYGMLGGEDLPRGVAIEWSTWGRHPKYIESAGATFSRVRAPLRALSFADDQFACRRAVEALVQSYGGAEREHVHLRPREVGMKAIGHFGFYRKEAQTKLWPDAVDWLTALASR